MKKRLKSIVSKRILLLTIIGTSSLMSDTTMKNKELNNFSIESQRNLPLELSMAKKFENNKDRKFLQGKVVIIQNKGDKEKAAPWTTKKEMIDITRISIINNSLATKSMYAFLFAIKYKENNSTKYKFTECYLEDTKDCKKCKVLKELDISNRNDNGYTCKETILVEKKNKNG